MKKARPAILLFMAFLCCYMAEGQTKFEKGYFVDSSGKRIECLILNLDWLYNPDLFTYKMDADAPKLIKTIPEVREFGIDHAAKYVSAKVRMDRSSDDLDEDAISNTSNPEWRDEEVFLKVMTEGEATLFSYEEQGLIRYFFKTKTTPIEQLVYKKYLNPGKTTFQYNRNYLNQLFVQVNCLRTPLANMENIAYSDQALLKWFQKQNQCADPTNVPVVSTKKRKLFSPKLLAGIGFASYQSGRSLIAGEGGIDYGHAAAPTYGVELEFIFPFRNNKWSCNVEPSTIHYIGSGRNSLGNEVSVEYNSINVLLWFRYTSFLSDKVKLCFNGGVGKDIKQLKLIPALGLGFAYSRVMLEYRYFYEKNLLNGYFDEPPGGSFSNMSLVAKFTIIP
jgi:hypothetical protein